MSETHTELLILPDGRILVHNLTPAMAALLHELDPRDRGMINRARVARARRHRNRIKQQASRMPHKP
jgi:hypothetical protein